MQTQAGIPEISNLVSQLFDQVCSEHFTLLHLLPDPPAHPLRQGLPSGCLGGARVRQGVVSHKWLIILRGGKLRQA